MCNTEEIRPFRNIESNSSAKATNQHCLLNCTRSYSFSQLSLSVDFISLVLIRVTVNNSQKKVLSIDYLAPDSYDNKFGSVGERTMES